MCVHISLFFNIYLVAKHCLNSDCKPFIQASASARVLARDVPVLARLLQDSEKTQRTEHVSLKEQICR